MIFPLILVSCLTASALGQVATTLPNYMLGEYVLETSDGFNDYMWQLGVNWFTRKIACALYPTATNKQTPNGDITVETSSTFKSTSITFRLDTPFEESTADGRTVSTTAVVNGNKIVKTQVGNPTTIETREFLENGDRMILIHTMPSEPSIKSVRGYVRTKVL
eukprot:TRINITY_DN3016_c0_g1_i1.p1 TRINITY_DN3016_c0_g1~~TRINITY_DN3016_c0_g1_i1.p1  ORF type:complete len:163 (-),score=42.47 TRINITY_DN3016_c0_g1_i1:151-639(-)